MFILSILLDPFDFSYFGKNFTDRRGVLVRALYPFGRDHTQATVQPQYFGGITALALGLLENFV